MVQLRDDITHQELSQKQFAAVLHDLVMNVNPGPCHDPREIFAMTYPTVKLRVDENSSTSAREMTRSCSTCLSSPHGAFRPRGDEVFEDHRSGSTVT
ncbi:MAG: hypothetical protein FWD57_09180, partial [Polyangiaceae bacterium]|nr:hypothetical protein [Polyangiaceae bacterium]